MSQTHFLEMGLRYGLRGKKEHKPKLLSPDLFRWGRGLPREGVAAKMFGMSVETREIKVLGAGYPGILLGNPGDARKV